MQWLLNNLFPNRRRKTSLVCQLGPRDIFVVESQNHLSVEEIRLLRAQFEELVTRAQGGPFCIVLGGGMTYSVINRLP